MFPKLLVDEMEGKECDMKSSKKIILKIAMSMTGRAKRTSNHMAGLAKKNHGTVEGHDEGEERSVLMGSNTTIY